MLVKERKREIKKEREGWGGEKERGEKIERARKRRENNMREKRKEKKRNFRGTRKKEK